MVTCITTQIYRLISNNGRQMKSYLTYCKAKSLELKKGRSNWSLSSSQCHKVGCDMAAHMSAIKMVISCNFIFFHNVDTDGLILFFGGLHYLHLVLTWSC